MTGSMTAGRRWQSLHLISDRVRSAQSRRASPSDRGAPARRHCKATRTLVDGGATLRGGLFLPLALSLSEGRDGEEKLWGYFPKRKRPAARAEAGHQGGKTMLEVVCPERDGAKQLFDIVGELGCGCQLGRRNCSFCRGSGEVTFEAAERWRAAQARDPMEHGRSADADITVDRA